MCLIGLNPLSSLEGADDKNNFGHGCNWCRWHIKMTDDNLDLSTLVFRGHNQLW